MKITSDTMTRRAKPLIGKRALSRGTYGSIQCESDAAVRLPTWPRGMKEHPRRSRLVILRRKGPFLAQINEFESRRICFGRGAGRDIHDQPEYHENEKKSRKQRQREKQDTSHDDSEHKFRHRGDPKERGSGHHNLNRAEKK
jgi:hypothetical protein